MLVPAGIAVHLISVLYIQLAYCIITPSESLILGTDVLEFSHSTERRYSLGCGIFELSSRERVSHLRFQEAQTSEHIIFHIQIIRQERTMLNGAESLNYQNRPRLCNL
jgi:hypothetical protein